MLKTVKKYLADRTGIYNINQLKSWFYLDKDDIILAAYPKVGSTWLRFLFCNLIMLQEEDGEIVDFHLLNEIMPHFGPGKPGNLKETWNYATVPRIVKTHRKYYWHFYTNNKIILQIRDPRDVMISYYHFQQSSKKNPFQGSLKDFLKDPDYGFKSFFEHYNSWKPHADIIVKYEELRSNTIESFQCLLNYLDISVQKDLVKEAVRRSDFNTVHAIEKKKGTHVDNRFGSNFQFTRKGTSGQYKEDFSREENEIYEFYRNKYGFDLY